MVPLMGLGSNQVNKSTNLGQRIEAYHVDKNHGNDFLEFVSCLISVQREDGRPDSSTNIFCSPQSLVPNSKLSLCFRKLTKLDLIISVLVNDAHMICREG